MSEEVEKRDVDTSPTKDAGKSATKDAGKSGTGDRTNVGSALRAVYQDAIGEDVPDEFLDLLSKLK